MRYSYPFTQDMVNQVMDFYWSNYTRQWSQPLFGDALATIPQVCLYPYCRFLRRSPA